MKKTFLQWTLIAGLVFGIFFGLGAGITKLVQQPAETPQEEQIAEVKPEYPDDGERTNILVLGVDARPGEENSRSDTMLLVSIDPKLDKAAIISIPRDTRIDIKGGFNKICAANFIGGPTYAVDRVEELMQTKIDYYVEADFNGFEKVIDILGGVTIDVPQRMYNRWEGIDLQPGVQKLDGKDSLAFVRFRDYVNGDIDRTYQQQVFVKALANEALKPKTITKLPSMVKQMKQYLDTDIGFTDMVRMASWAPGFSADSIITQTLPGGFLDEVNGDGVLLNSYWLADKDQAAKLLENLFAGKTVAVVQNSPPPNVIGSPTGEDEDKTEDNDTNENGIGTDTDAPVIIDLDQQRANLPSPGHNGEILPLPAEPVEMLEPVIADPVITDPGGPEGYI